MSSPVRPLALIFALSGAAGLIYEVAWARALGQSLGQSLQAITAVMVVFLVGLGVGAALGARSAERSRTPLRAYARLEFLIAGAGLLSPLALHLAPSLFELLGPRLDDGAPLAALRLGLTFLVLAPPTVAMGATLPFVVRAAQDRGVAADGAVALLYGSNTLGAAGGALLGSFALLPLAGTRGTIMAAALMNLVAGLAAWRLRRSGAPMTRPVEAPARPLYEPEDRAARPFPAALALGVAAISGALGAILQVGWVRVISLTFGSSTYALGLSLTAYIFGLGAGPLLANAWPAARRRPLLVRAAAAQWCVGLFALMLLPLFGVLPTLAAWLSGRLSAAPLVLLALQFVTVALMLLPAAMAQGAAFPPLALLAGARSGRVHAAAGRAFAASSCGSALGFLVAGFVLVPAFGTRGSLGFAAAAALLLCALLWSWHDATRQAGRLKGRSVHRLRSAVAIGAPLLILALPAWDRLQMSGGGFLYGPIYRAALGGERIGEAIRRRGELLFYREDGAGIVTVRRNRAGLLSLQINGKTEASSGADMATQLLTTHLPLLLHPRPRDLMLIGLASGVSLGAAERHPIATAWVVEIIPSVVDAARFFDPYNGAALEDPRVRVIIDDARSQLLARTRQYDVIASQPSNPWVAGVANLFTVDFYRLARRRLRPDGIFLQWVQAYRIEPRDLRGIVGSFLKVFPGATLWEESAGGGDYFLLGGLSAEGIDPARLRNAPPGVWEDLQRAGIDGPAALLSRFVAGPTGLKAFAAGAPLHTDDNLYLEWRAPLALFRDTLTSQVATLSRFREPVTGALIEGVAEHDPELLAELGVQLRQRAARLRLAQGLRDADRLALTDPYLAAGIEYLRSGRFIEAIGALSRAATENSRSANTHLLLGEAYRGAGLLKPAIVALREALRQDADLAAAWNALGQCRVEQQSYDEARHAFATAVRLDPYMASARNNLGTLYLLTDDPRLAEESFRTALRIAPDLPAAHANLGLALRRRGDAAGSEAAYREALRRDPLHLDARFNLAKLLNDEGRPREARAEAEQILAIDPADKDVVSLLEIIDRGAPGN